MRSRLLPAFWCGMPIAVPRLARCSGQRVRRSSPAADPIARAGRPARPGAVQGDRARADAVRRPAPGHRPQSRRRRLDRGAAQELRLHQHRADPLRVHRPPDPAGRFDPRRTRRSRARPGLSPLRAGRRRSRPATCSRAFARATGVNMNPELQPDTALRRIDAQPDTPGEREEVYCTKVGTTHPDEMYIVSGHMDGHGFGPAANDDGSGTALVMELARVFNVARCAHRPVDPLHPLEQRRDRPQRRARLRRSAQGPAGEGRSRRLGEVPRTELARHDPARHDDVRSRHAGTRRQGESRSSGAKPTSTSNSPARRRWPTSRQKLAWFFRGANDKYATDYPAAVGDRMSNTDSDPFKDLVPTHFAARERTPGADRHRLGSAVAPADRRLLHLFRQGFPARTQCRADHAGRHRAVDRRNDQEVT